MALSFEGRQLTLQHRQRQLALRAAALRDLLVFWRTVDPANLTGTIRPFATAAAILTVARFQDSASLAARYYERLRRVEGVEGQTSIILPPAPQREQTAGLIRGAALSGIINARRRGFSIDAAARNGLVKASGSLSHVVLGASRQVVTQAAASDPASGRWRRVAGGGACEFCLMLESRGAVFSESTGGFEAHNHCACTAEPVFG